MLWQAVNSQWVCCLCGAEDVLKLIGLQPSTKFTFGAGASFVRLAMAITSKDKDAFFAAVCELGTKLGVREAGAFVGLVSGDPAYIPQVSELATRMGLPARLAQALVGVATGSVAYMDVGADVLAKKLHLGSVSTVKSLALIVRGKADMQALSAVASRLGINEGIVNLVIGAGS